MSKQDGVGGEGVDAEQQLVGANPTSRSRSLKWLVGGVLLCGLVGILVWVGVRDNDSNNNNSSSVRGVNSFNQNSNNDGTFTNDGTQQQQQQTSTPTLSPTSVSPTTKSPTISPTTNSPTVSPTASLTPTTSPTQTTSPTTIPTLSPTKTFEPTALSSDVPSLSPSNSPSDIPSHVPTPVPTTLSPTNAPTPERLYIPPNPVPKNPPRGYFNYDMSDNKYGPKNWKNVDTSRHPLREFGPDGWGVWKNHWDYLDDPTENQCGGRSRKQSPKDLYQVAGGSEPGWCEATHEIRSRCGKHGLDSEEIEKQILPHKLSLVMNRRVCLDVEQESCRENDPPLADYPKYASAISSYSDLLNFDIKVPGEHTIEGQSYHAEIQMLHTHVDKGRISSLGIPITATMNGHNAEFQEVLNAFQQVHYRHALGCNVTTTNRRYLRYLNATFLPEPHHNTNRTLQIPRHRFRFNPYTEAFMPSIFFYRYDGSTTDPPCLPLTWWVMIDPMIISFEQLNQIRYLIFTHVDPETCEPTSVHNEQQEVTRPIQPLGEDRGIQYCPPGSFILDELKGRGDGNIC